MGVTAPITVAPTAMPVTVADMKAHCRIDGDEENRLVELYLASAVEIVESLTNRQLMPATRRLTLDRFPPFCEERFRSSLWPRAIALPFAPCRSVTSVVYVDPDGSSQTLSSDVYSLSADREPALLKPKTSQSWPSISDEMDSVTVTYACGYDNAQSVPMPLRQAVTLITAEWFRDREPLARSTGLFESAAVTSVRTLLDNLKVVQ